MQTEGSWDRMREVAERRLKLAAKATIQWLDLPDDVEPRPLFVVGCQRSGTTMLIDTLMKAPHLWVHPEKSALAYNNYRLRSPDTIRTITHNTPATVVIYKPLCDAHLTDRMLVEHPQGEAIWMVRRFRDVANSSVRKWGDHHKKVVLDIAAGRWDRLGWRGERLPPRLIDQVREIADPEMLPEAGAAMFWYLRNSFYFALGLDQHPRVTLSRYEDLVTRPQQAFPALFAQIGVPFDSAYVSDIVPTSVGKAPFPEINNDVQALCEALTVRLDECYERLRVVGTSS